MKYATKNSQTLYHTKNYQGTITSEPLYLFS